MIKSKDLRIMKRENLLSKITTIVALVFCLSYQGAGQSEPPVFIMETFGKTIKAKSSTKKKMKLINGSVVNYGAKIKIPKGGKILTLQNNKFVWLDQAGKQVLSKSKEDKGKMSLRSFDPLFANYVTASYAMAFENISAGHYVIKESVERGDGWGTQGDGGKGGWGTQGDGGKGGWGTQGDGGKGGWGTQGDGGKGGWGTQGDGGKGGWGTQGDGGKGGFGVTAPNSNEAWGTQGSKSKGGWTEDDMIITSYSPGGFYEGKINRLSWASHPEVKKFMFCIFDKGLNIVDSVITQTSSIEYDFAKLNSGEQYYWQIFANNQNAISAPIIFSILEEEELQSIESRVSNSKIYKNSSEAIQQLMMVTSYEDNKLYNSCLITYQMLVNKFPDNDLIKINFAAFCQRVGQNWWAKGIIEKI